MTARYLTAGIYKKKAGSLEIKPSKFGILPGLIEPDVLQAMQQVPGISSVDQTVSNISVRGGTHDQNLFLWNGIRMFQTGHFFGLISAFNSSLAQTISITKNGSSAFFNESVSSLITISSHTQPIEKNTSSISTNLISAEFSTQIKTSGKSDLVVSGRRSMTDFFSSPTYKNYRDRIFQNTIVTDLTNNETINVATDENFYFYDFTVQYHQKIGSKNDVNVDGIVIRNALALDQSTVDITKTSYLQQQNFGANIDWKTSWNQNHFTQFKGYMSNYSLTAENEAIQNNQITNQENKVSDLGLQFVNSNRLSEAVTLRNGYQLEEIGVANFDEINTPFFSRRVKQVLQNHALITEGIYENKRTFLKAGIRTNYFSKFQMYLVEPRIQFRQALSRTLFLEILGERKSQTLSQRIDLQQDFLGIEKRRWTLADNATVPIQKSSQLSVGFSYSDKSWLITLDGFYKKVTGISTSGQGFQNQFEFIRSNGNYRVLGSEILIQKNFDKFYSWLSYSYNDNQYQFKSLQPSEFINNYQLKHVVVWAGIYEWNRLKLALGAKWHTGKPITTPLTTELGTNDEIQYHSPNNSKLEDFLEFNCSASKDWKINKHVTLQSTVSVLNLFNAQNSVNKFYRINTAGNAIESVDTYALERTPNLQLKLYF